jgi:hypothetical protein
MTNTRINLLTATIKDLQETFAKGEVTSVQLVADYLVSCCVCPGIVSGFELILASKERIKRDNLEGLELRAVMETAPEGKLLEIARGFDEMRAKGVRLRFEQAGVNPDHITVRTSWAPYTGFQSWLKTTSGQILS